MKTFYTIILISVAQICSAQITGYTLLAEYPLTSDALDATGNHAEATLENAPYQNGGVYSNGIYNDGTNSGSIIQTPNISELNPMHFILTCEFMIDETPTMDRPLILMGSSWRWLGVSTNTVGNSGEFFIYGNDGADNLVTSAQVPFSAWSDLRLTMENGTVTLNIEGNDIGSETFTPNHNNDFTITCYNGGSSDNYKGYIREIKIYNKSSVGIDGPGVSDDLSIYPNPVESTLHIISPNLSVNNEIRVLDMCGRSVMNVHSTGTESEIDLTELDSGVYMVEVDGDDGTFYAMKKFQKL